LRKAIDGCFWGIGLAVSGVVIIHVPVVEMLGPHAVSLAAEPMLDRGALWVGLCLVPLGIALLLYSASGLRAIFSGLNPQRFPWDSNAFSRDRRGMLRLRAGEQCIYCHQPTKRRRETWLRFYDASLNAGALLGGLWAGIGGAMMGSAVGGLFKRPKSWPRNASGIGVNYGVCTGCRPDLFRLRCLWPAVAAVGWMLLCWIVAIAAGKGDESPSDAAYMVVMYPALIAGGAFGLSAVLTERVGDAVRIRFDSAAITVETASGDVEPASNPTG